jgi:hypothetical protein
MTDPKRAERQWKALAVAMQMAVLVGGQEEACEREYKPKKARKSLQKRRRGRPPKPIQRPRGREQSVLVRGQQTIHTAVVRGEEIPEGHVVTEEWPKQTYRVGKPTKSWASKCKEKEAKQRHQKSKQARAGQGESTPTQAKPGKKQQYPNPAKEGAGQAGTGCQTLTQRAGAGKAQARTRGAPTKHITRAGEAKTEKVTQT